MVEQEAKAFRKLLVWKRAHELTLMIYRASENFPRDEIFGLTSQIRRACVSIEANIAEGYALGTAANYLRHLSISAGSLAEAECHFEVVHDLGYLPSADYQQLMEKAREVGYLLSRLKLSIERKTAENA